MPRWGKRTKKKEGRKDERVQNKKVRCDLRGHGVITAHTQEKKKKGEEEGGGGKEV